MAAPRCQFERGLSPCSHARERSLCAVLITLDCHGLPLIAACSPSRERSLCAVFNEHAPRPRQLLSTVVGHRSDLRKGTLGPSILNYTSLLGPLDCQVHLRANERRYCLVGMPGTAPEADGARDGAQADAQYGALHGTSDSDDESAVMSEYVRPAALEAYDAYKPRCGRLCS